MSFVRRHGPVAALLTAASLSCGGQTTTNVDTSTITAVAIAPVVATMVSVGDTLLLTATARNGAGTAVAATFSWTVSDPAIATLSVDGRLVAQSNGLVTVTATAAGVSGTAAVTVEQAIASLAVVSGDAQGGDVLSALDSLVTVLAMDARGNPAVGRPVTFTVAEGGGAPSIGEVMTDEAGLASVNWTLGAAVGAQLLAIGGGGLEIFVSAAAYPLQAAAIRYVSGNVQEELYGQPLPEPLVVQVVDSLGNGVPDVPVHFSIVGAGILSADSVVTDLDGMASVEMTVGTVFGRDTIFATVRDSVIADIVDFPGSPVRFFERALGLFMDATPPTVFTGDTVTVIGHGFAPDPTGTPLTVGGLPVEVIGGGQREITFVIPDFGCSPEAPRWLIASRDTFDIIRKIPVVPRSQIELAVGERHAYGEGDTGCVQLPGGTDTEYLVGLTSTRWLDAAATFAMTAYDSIGALPAPQPGPSRVAAPRLQRFTSLTGGEMRLRRWEAERLNGLPRASSGPVLVPPVPGEALALRLPDLLGDPCVDYSELPVDVVWVGPRLAVSSAVPLASPLDVGLQAALSALSATFGTIGVDAVADFLGLPDDWDPDTRVHVVLAPGVGAMGVSTFSTGVDQLPRATCPASDEGRYIYVDVPDAATVLQIVAALDGIGPRLAHDLAHIVQAGRRIGAGGSLLPAWLAEGQAQVAVEAAGLAVLNLSAQGNHGASQLLLPGADAWLGARLDRLALYQGWDGGTGTNPNSPDTCSLYGFIGAHVSCDPEYASGAAWSFVRYLSDRVGVSQGDESSFHQALLDAGAGEDPLAAWTTLARATYAELVMDWAASLYVDGRLSPAQAPALQLASWDLQSVFPAGPKRLAPAPFDFTDFTREGSLLGGGTVYSLVGSGSAHPPIAISVGNGVGGPVAAELRPRLWVVRMR